MLRISCLLIAVFWAIPSAAQQTAVVTSNDPEALVYADSTWLGPASREVFALPAGARELRVVPRNVGTWGVSGFSAPIARRDTTWLTATFPLTYRLEATPYAASVWLNNGDVSFELGSTPLVYQMESAQGTFVFLREGFAPVEITPGTELWNRHTAVLQPLSPAVATTPDIHLEVGQTRRTWIDYAAVGAALVGGSLAVHYKLKADNRFETYLETGDPDLRPVIEDLDTRSAIALGAMQAGVTVFALRLVLR